MALMGETEDATAGELPLAPEEPTAATKRSASGDIVEDTAPAGLGEPSPKKVRANAQAPAPAAGGYVPPFPTPLTAAAIVNAVDTDPMMKYIDDTVDYVHHHLLRYLQQPPGESKLQPSSAPLAERQPIDIEHMEQGDAMLTFREAFNKDHAIKVLQLMGVVEAAGNLFWLDVKAPNMWKGTALGGSAISLAQLIAARSLFTKDQLVA